MRIDQTKSKLLKIKNEIPSNLINEKYKLKLGEFNNTTGTEKVEAGVHPNSIFSIWKFFGNIYSCQ